MFFGSPQPTAFDLHWRMFGIDVRVHPFFWLMALMLGWSWSNVKLLYLVLWVGCVFVSVLIHELGHVVMGRVFGSYGHILLYSFGGLAFNASNVRYRWQRVCVIFAGPLVQLVLFGALLAFALVALPPAAKFDAQGHATPILTVVVMMLEINFFWPLLNLLPILPLDGGQISREVFQGTLGQRGLLIALGISFGSAVILALLMVINSLPFLPSADTYTAILYPLLNIEQPARQDQPNIYMAILFAMLAVGSFQMLQMERNRGRYEERLPWE